LPVLGVHRGKLLIVHDGRYNGGLRWKFMTNATPHHPRTTLKHPPSTDADIVRSRSRTVTLVGRTAVLILGVRVLFLFAEYMTGSSRTQRFHVESAALMFVAVGHTFRLARRDLEEYETASSRGLPYWMWFVFSGLAIVLYWPALSVGFLSDDFVLLARASSWSVGPVTLRYSAPYLSSHGRCCSMRAQGRELSI
jgi:hypothetical protein